MTGPEQFAKAREAAKREFDEREGNRSKPYMREFQPNIEEPEFVAKEMTYREWIKAIFDCGGEVLVRQRTEVEEEEGERVKGCL